MAFAILALAATALLLLGRASTPQRTSEEGVSRAWAVEHLPMLDGRPSASDRSPLARAQLQAVRAVTGPLPGSLSPVAIGRLALVVANLASMALLWALARRTGLTRWAAGIAVAVFGLSPLAVHFHRTLLPENLAVPWLLGAFVLATAPRRRVVPLVGASLCLAVATLTSETTLLAVPALVWTAWRTSRPAERDRNLVVAAAPVAIVVGGYLALAADDRSGMPFRLFRPDGGGGVLDSSSLAHRIAAQWFELDPVLVASSLVAVLCALVWVPRLRPAALAFTVIAASAMRGGSLPIPFVVPLLALAALLVAGGLDEARRRWSATPIDDRLSRRALPASIAALAGVVVVVAPVVGAPGAVAHLRRLTDTANEPAADAARGWLADNLGPGERVLADDVMAVDLIDGHLPPDVVVALPVAADPGEGRSLTGVTYIVSTSRFRSGMSESPATAEALAESEVAAGFGSGDERVEIRRIGDDGPRIPRVQGARDDDLASRAGDALLRNASITVSPEAADQLLAGEVDDRLLTVLATLGVDHRFEVRAFPSGVGEEGAVQVRRIAELEVIDGEPVGPNTPGVTAVQDFFAAQPDQFRPEEAEVDLGVFPVVFRISFRPDPP